MDMKLNNVPYASPLANAEGRFLFLTYAGKEDILNTVKSCANGPRHEDYGREQPEAGTAFDTSARPPALWIWAHKCIRELCMGCA